jgi:KipI family sensor histidine kinase inhibitor
MRTLSHVELRPSGPYASIVELGERPSPATSHRVAAVREALLRRAPPEVRDVVPGFTGLLVEHRPSLSRRRLRAWLHAAEVDASHPGPGRLRTVPVVYGADADVAEIERGAGLPFAEVARRHAGHEATVAFLGFTPGFAYLLGLPSELHLPRRARPRPRTPAGAVAIAEGLGGIYPSASPGGWWVLGRTPLRLFDAWADEPAWLTAGDRVRFEPVAGPLPEAPADPVPPVLGPALLEVIAAVPGSASVQAAPRYGVGHLGAAQAGALDPVALEVGNRLLGNPARAPALETVGQPLRVRALREVRAAWTGGGMRLALDGHDLAPWRAFRWPRGAVLDATPDPRAAGRTGVLCLAGGVAGERWRGSYSTDVRAGAGGSRRWLRAGDRLGTLGLPAGPPLAHPGRPRPPTRVLVRLHAGPQFDARAFAALTGRAFRIADLDRTGVRLDGPAVPHPTPSIASDGSPLGAVQVPPDGRPIVLLADRGRTGGYAKPGVVDPRDVWRFAQARPGDEVAFVDARGAPERLGAPEPLDSWT